MRPDRRGAARRSTSPSRDGKIARLAARHRRRRRPRPSSTAAAGWPSPASSTPTSTGASTTRWSEDAAHREPRLRAGRRHHGAHLHAHRAVLPEQGRPVRATSSPRCSPPAEGRSYVDYAFHLAPMIKRAHRRDPRRSSSDFGVTSFKIFMFYGSHGLHGALDDQSDFLMIPRGRALRLRPLRVRHARRPAAARGSCPELADQISLSLHCETAEIMTRLHQAWSRRRAR